MFQTESGFFPTRVQPPECTLLTVIKQRVLPWIPEPLLIRWRRYRNKIANRPVISYAFQGEDMILRRLLGHLRVGFYVDIGACYPILMSNTYWFYRRGWSGLNVDARPGSMRWFRILRRRDINIESAVSNSSGKATFFLSDSDRHTDSLTAAAHHEYSIVVDQITVADLLNSNLAPDQLINFMSIDVEGHDLEVLQSNDWSVWRPQYVAVEQLGTDSLEEVLHDPTTVFMASVGYRPIAANGLTCIFQCQKEILGNDSLD